MLQCRPERARLIDPAKIVGCAVCKTTRSSPESVCSSGKLRLGDNARLDTGARSIPTQVRVEHPVVERSLGKKDPRSIRIELRISHEELSEMVGTTRPRITFFMQRFRKLGLLETNSDHFLIIKEHKLTDYLAQIA